MQLRLYKVDVEVEARENGTRRVVKFDLFAATESEARSKAAKIAERIGHGRLIWGGFFVRQAARTHGRERA